MQPGRDKDNNFDFLRLAAATGVLLSHQFALSGRPEPLFINSSWGGLGVLVFFAISGYLIAGSWVRDPHLWRFAVRRFLRIWPGLAVATVLVVFVLGPLVSSLGSTEYFSSPVTWTYLNLLGLWEFESQLPGIFAGNPVPQSANGSLWTIPIEVKCYALLALVGVLGFMRRSGLLLVAAFAASAVWFFFLLKMGYDNPLRMKLQMGVVFFSGSCLCVLRSHWLPHRRWFALLSALTIAALWFGGWQEVAMTLGLPLATVVFGSCATPLLRRAGRFGDISYGLYIYAFPVQQTIIWVTGNRLSVLEGACFTVPVTVALAFLSWHLVERPALLWKDRLGAGAPHRASASAVVGRPVDR
ncbi:acyltransferase family protein [Xylophilus sp. ASV27]|uniref:acyltransferase family protein n=1 Tax=Xylophilus sp. ASV27 TaxID=2795129 RepID=UPI0018EABD4E|nr:acyltransferase [Xylophilus sp. ASV27]